MQNILAWSNCGRSKAARSSHKMQAKLDIKLIAAVPSSSGQPLDISEDNQRTQKKRDKLYDMMEIIAEFI